MGQSPVTHTICCSLREKYDAHNNGFPVATGPPQFFCSEVHIGLESPKFLSFAPLWQRDNSPPRRLAIATKREVHVYLVTDTESTEGESLPRLRLENSMALDSDTEITSMIFSDESSSRTLVVAVGPNADGASPRGSHQVRFFSCEAQATRTGEQLSEQDDGDVPVNVWKWNDDYTAALEDHGARVTHLVTSQTILVSADSSGTCGTWQKNKGFSKRHTSAKLHKSSIADISVDRYFVYTCGREDKKICIWSVPELQPIMETVVSIPKDILIGGRNLVDAMMTAPIVEQDAPQVASPTAVGDRGCTEASVAMTSMNGTVQLSALTALRRPLSRWAGSQGSSRSAKAPKGTLFVAAVLAEECEVAGAGAGVLMEWALGASGDKQAVCQSAQVAHDSPIVSIAYGPYDNGPVITVDTRGIFRVWDCVPRLTCSQNLEFFTAPHQTMPQLAMAVEPQRGLYSSNGDRRLFVWRRTQSQEFILPYSATS